MLFSNRQSALKVAILVSLMVLTLFYFFPSYVWPNPSEITISNPFPPSALETSPPKTAPSVLAAIPEKIWYKLGPRGINQQTQEWIDSCLDKNPSYKSEFLTDESGDLYVKEKFAHRPDVVKAFLALPFPILKADLLRYLLLYNEGGIYSDLDVSCENVPMSDWVPAQYKKNASLVVGWEFDVGWQEGFVREFATWTIMAKPGSPHMLMVVDDILEGLREKEQEHNTTIKNMSWAMIGDVVDLTGPRRMTRSILKSLKYTLGDQFEEKSLAALSEPKLVADVLVLPGYSFALGSNHYKPEDIQAPVLVTHHGIGSWKNDHGGEMADDPVS